MRYTVCLIATTRIGRSLLDEADNRLERLEGMMQQDVALLIAAKMSDAW